MSEMSVAELVKSIQADVATIVRGEVELAKAELLPQAKSVGIGVGLFGGAGYLVLTGSIMLFFGVGFALALLYQAIGLELLLALLLGFLTLAVLLFLLAGVLALLGKGRFKLTGPERTVDSVTQSVGVVLGAVETSRKEIAGKGADLVKDPE